MFFLKNMVFLKNRPYDLQEKYGLIGPVAGTAIVNPYTDEGTPEMACVFSQCIGSPFPDEIPGATDPDTCPLDVASHSHLC